MESYSRLPKSGWSIDRCIKQELARLEVHDITPSFSSRVHDALFEARAKDHMLWAKLTLEDLSPRYSERRTLYTIDLLPNTLDSAIKQVIERFRWRHIPNEAKEVDSIVTWMGRSLRPLSLLDLCTALGSIMPSEKDAIALGKRILNRYILIFKLIRDDGVFSEFLDDQSPSLLQAPLRFIPATTRVKFTHK
ncbi:hypothetical protein CC86DRAFT_184976 [Ophiobolus disseminans]|uniref:Uncharacterized protein n=1 Tax=Ophiobolus disseminans TaxID=1469910 RepID=A0A6A7A8T5_9PLEO|nr:hypothetical protein CC86DRAFT_184976 [Ophiobolus disseminans]